MRLQSKGGVSTKPGWHGSLCFPRSRLSSGVLAAKAEHPCQAGAEMALSRLGSDVGPFPGQLGLRRQDTLCGQLILLSPGPTLLR